ncbi:MAG TPA: alpha-L-arabinofuranosidase C-terminal domain-containing protein [Balneolales bacterium]|nr:alpha-L-arabinofuranosidase C-terminal domain-containing protein [Balneolales bacterium]
MKIRLIIKYFLVLFFAYLLAPGLLQAQNAEIKIDIDRTVGKVNNNIYGNFAEHLGRCIYGGIYDPGSKLSDKYGYRNDVMQAVKKLHVSILRYPGGNFASNYHWQDGIGPKDQRPARLNLAWGNLDSNHFGTDEFIQYCRMIGAKPYLTVNMGTGTMSEAQSWVEYCNVKSGPYYANLRKKYGHSEPYNVKYWSLGNEMDGPWQIGHLDAKDYSKKAHQFAHIMKLTDPSIKLIGDGGANFRPDAHPYAWDQTVLKNLKNDIDYLSMHMYVGNLNNNYYDFVATPMVTEQRTKVVKGMIDAAMQTANRGDRDPIYIAWDEYNVWYRARGGSKMVGNHALEEKYNLEDALVVSEFLNVFVRNADIVKMANLAQLVNVIAPIFTSKTGMYLQSIYYPLQLFAENVHGTSLNVKVNCQTYNTKKFYIGLGERQKQISNVPYLDVSATYDNGKVVISVVNRNKDKAITSDLISETGHFNGPFKVYQVDGPNVKSKNDFNHTSVKTTQKADFEASGQKVSYTFPPHSLTMLIGHISK